MIIPNVRKCSAKKTRRNSGGASLRTVRAGDSGRLAVERIERNLVLSQRRPRPPVHIVPLFRLRPEADVGGHTTFTRMDKRAALSNAIAIELASHNIDSVF
jgi:hypothetical protein